jgi:4-amino-4-deoxy-L-arabinose transferase-like glycosyltransferase
LRSARPDPGRPRAALAPLAPLAVVALIAASLLWLASRTTLWDRDEPRFAQATVEMAASGNHLLPTFNGALRPDKPILIYWLMLLPLRLLGPTALAARFWAPLGIALAALATFLIGRRLFSTAAGLWAMAVLAATPLAVIEGQAATTDAVLLAAIAAAAACFTAGAEGGGQAAWWGLGAALGLAQLAKGPVGLLLPGISIAAYLWLRRRAEVPPAPGTARRAALAALLGVALFCAWGVPANLASGGELARLGLGRHFAGRALAAMEGHGGGSRWLGLPFYLAVIGIGFAPWVAYLPAAISAALGGRLGGRRGRAFLVAWGLAPPLLMSLSATRLPHYILPAWPVLALAVGATLEAERQGKLAPRDLAWLRRGSWLLALPLALGLTAAALLALPSGSAPAGGAAAASGGPIASGPAAGGSGATASNPAARGGGADASGPAGGGAAMRRRDGIRGTFDVAAVHTAALHTAMLEGVALTGLRLPGLALALVLVVTCGCMLGLLQLAGRGRQAVIAGFAGFAGFAEFAGFAGLAGTAAALAVAGWAVAPAVERLKPVPDLAAAVRAASPPAEPVAMLDFAEPSLVFYLHRWPVRELVNDGQAAEWAAEPAPGVLVLPRSTLRRLTGQPWATGLREIAASSGWNVSKGAWLELVAVRRAGVAAAQPTQRR